MIAQRNCILPFLDLPLDALRIASSTTRIDVSKISFRFSCVNAEHSMYLSGERGVAASRPIPLRTGANSLGP